MMMLLNLKRMQGFHVTGGYWDEGGTWIAGISTPVDVYGNVQYIDDMIKKEKLIEEYGLDNDSIVEIFTSTPLAVVFISSTSAST